MVAAIRWAAAALASLAATEWASGEPGSGQGEESADFGVVQAAAKQAAASSGMARGTRKF